MGRLAKEDDKHAVLRRLDRHAPPEPEPSAQTDRRRPSISGRLVAVILAIISGGLIALWAPWQSAPAPVRPENSEVQTGGSAAVSGNVDASSDGLTGDKELVGAEEVGEAADAGGEGAVEEETVVINIVGHVAEPGVITLPAGSRVEDAIIAAGGATKEADLTRLNLARILADEEYLAVLGPQEDPPELLDPTTPSGAGSSSGSSSGSGAGEGSDAVLNLNTAGPDELETLPGVGPVMAERIIAWREENDGFHSVDELREVSGVGPKIFEQLAGRVTT